ncbi:lipoate--protein ligase family protein [Schlesneria paludicola]|uniref:lipoate--protein ligase family protein n=1 Tax=Schlesneria paludicola TaxID=360056 RepID=UPI00030EAE0E|nr:lipoate--protein ligase [Schlesneria paludicola]
MSRLPYLRVLIDPVASSGAWNMAVDEALLESAITDNVATLRWYQWREPTVSLGYFQKSADLVDNDSIAGLPVVRRLTGGGAILHDNELTYSICLPASQSLFAQPHELYDIVHLAIIGSLRQLDFPVTLRGSTWKRPDEPLLCFQRQDAHDVTLNGQKILGSAQRRRRGAIMEHGSLIRKSSEHAPQILGLQDLISVSLPENLATILTVSVADAVAEAWSIGNLTESEIALCQNLEKVYCTNMQVR